MTLQRRLRTFFLALDLLGAVRSGSSILARLVLARQIRRSCLGDGGFDLRRGWRRLPRNGSRRRTDCRMYGSVKASVMREQLGAIRTGIARGRIGRHGRPPPIWYPPTR